MGTTSKLAVCGDGMSVAQWEQAGAAKKGISVEQWRKEVADTLGAATEKDVAAVFGSGKSKAAKGYAANAGGLAKKFNSVSTAFADPSAKTKTATPWSSSGQLQDLLEGKVPGFKQFGGTGTGYTQNKRPMWWYLWKKGYVVEADWQHQTTVSWVDQATGRRVYVSSDIPYVVKRKGTDYDFPMGSIVKLTPGGGNGPPTYAQVLESGPAGENKLELSQGTWDRLGQSKGPSSGYSLDYSQVTKGGTPGAAGTQLTGDQIQLAGALGDAGLLERGKGAISVNDLSNSLKKNNITPENIPEKLQKSLNDGGKKALGDLDAQAKEKAKKEKEAKEKQGQASADAGGGRYQLVKGFPTVAVGQNQRLVGYADAACLHTGGGYVLEGSSTVYVGQFPLARVADSTSDGYAVKTGDDTVFIGGAPTSATLA